MRLYSIFFIQNYFSFESSYDFKMSIMYVTSSAGVVGILSSITLPSTILILYLNLFYRVVSFKSFKGLVTIIASLLIVIDSFPKIVFFIYCSLFFTCSFFNYSKKKII